MSGDWWSISRVGIGEVTVVQSIEILNFDGHPLWMDSLTVLSIPSLVHLIVLDDTNDWCNTAIR